MHPPGINPDRYLVYAVVPLPHQRKAYLQRAVSEQEPLPYCAYIGGNGHYFMTESEMQEYIRCRLRKR